MGTQNPITMNARIKTTLPIQHRVETLVIPLPDRAEMISILTNMKLPRAISVALVDEYLNLKKTNGKILLQDLINAVING